MAEPVYLYGHGRKRHIAATATGLSLCGSDGFLTDEQKARSIRRWNTAEQTERAMDRLRKQAVCKPCATALAREAAL